ncbi:MAG: FliM/FliN family flagellar motor switch protein [Planctomycetota bacterium]
MSASTDQKTEQSEGVKPYRFGRPGMLRDEEMTALRRINRNLPAQVRRGTKGILPGGLRVELDEVRQGGWDRGLEEIPDSPVGCRFLATPGEHRGMVVTGLPLAGACVAQALGQESDGDEEELTLLETRLFSRIVQGVVDVLPRAWREIGQFEVEVEKYLSDPRGEAPLRPDRNYVHFLLSARCGAEEGTLSLSFPSLPLRRLATPQVDEESPEGRDEEDTAEGNLRRTPVELTVVLGRAELTPDELTNLQAGDVVMLDTTPEDPLEVDIEEAGKLLGTPARRKGRRAVKIEDKVEEGRHAGE